MTEFLTALALVLTANLSVSDSQPRERVFYRNGEEVRRVAAEPIEIEVSDVVEEVLEPEKPAPSNDIFGVNQLEGDTASNFLKDIEVPVIGETFVSELEDVLSEEAGECGEDEECEESEEDVQGEGEEAHEAAPPPPPRRNSGSMIGLPMLLAGGVVALIAVGFVFMMIFKPKKKKKVAEEAPPTPAISDASPSATGDSDKLEKVIEAMDATEEKTE